MSDESKEMMGRAMERRKKVMKDHEGIHNVEKIVENSMRKKVVGKMAGGKMAGSSPVFGANAAKSGPTDQLKNSMRNYGPEKMAKGGMSAKKGGKCK